MIGRCCCGEVVYRPPRSSDGRFQHPAFGVAYIDGRDRCNKRTRFEREFVSYLQKLDAEYVDTAKIQVTLDNHSTHTSKETRTYLQTVPNRFEFVFAPKHTSWVNISVFLNRSTGGDDD